jgi:hypothetical protein
MHPIAQRAAEIFPGGWELRSMARSDMAAENQTWTCTAVAALSPDGKEQSRATPARDESWGGGITQLPAGGYSTGQAAGRHRHNRFASSAQDPGEIVVTADSLVESFCVRAGGETGPEPAQEL